MDRVGVVKVIRSFAEKLAQPRSSGTPMDRARDPEAVRAALIAACQENGVPLEDYHAALQSDPSLADLERQAMTAEVVETPDPGPYGAISRESPSGQPGNLEKFRTVPRVLSGGS